MISRENAGLRTYVMTPKQNEILKRHGFHKIVSNVVFGKAAKTRLLKQLADKVTGKGRSYQGLYFWLIEIDRARYKVYIGRTKDVRKRFRDYYRDFQPASPNDHKIKFFWEYWTSQLRPAKLSLYFKGCSKNQLIKMESYYNNEFRPTIFQAIVRLRQNRNILVTGYRKFYDRQFRRALGL